MPGEKPRVCLAETSGKLGLYELQEDGSLQEVRVWDFKGRVTNGPFLRTPKVNDKDQGQRIGCVVDHTRLVWLDPNQDAPLWDRQCDKGVAVVGQPQLVGQVLLVADQSGRFAGLDPKTGKAEENHKYTLRGMAAAASPVPFGPGLAFAPLSDGTVLLLRTEN